MKLAGNGADAEPVGASYASQHTCPETLRAVGIWEHVPESDRPRQIV